MNDNQPQSDPLEHQSAPPEQGGTYPARKGEPQSGAGCLGFFLFIATVVMTAFFREAGLVIGCGIALACLFISGYRYVFVGFILSLLISVGLIYLLLIVFCSGMRNI